MTQKISEKRYTQLLRHESQEKEFQAALAGLNGTQSPAEKMKQDLEFTMECASRTMELSEVLEGKPQPYVDGFLDGIKWASRS
jgi:hypothetical protein